MSDELTAPEGVKFDDDRFEGHRLTSALDHAPLGDGSRPPLPPQPAGPRIMTRRIPVQVRSPFLPDHHGHASGALKPHRD